MSISICKNCGNEFTTNTHESYCSDKCRMAVKKRYKKKYFSRYYDEYAPAPPVVHEKTDWATITRLCAETHMTYGQLVARGII